MDFFGEEDTPLNEFSPIDFRKELNDEQYAAVTSPDGPVLVLAGAGSGKTRTLTYRVAYLLLKKSIPAHEILLLTFTNKAAREMVDRMEELTGYRPPQLMGGTFHHVGQRLLRRYGHLVGLNQSFNIVDQDDAITLLTETIKEQDPTFLKNKDNPKAKLIANVISLARNKLMSISDLIDEKFPYLEEHSARITRFAEGYQKRKKSQAVTDYDDLLCYWLELLQEHSEVAERLQKQYRYLLVDEYQDTNRLQSTIVDLMGAHHNIMVVGDDAQCIYTWRGAEFENIMSFPDRHPDTRIYKIETNYRSAPEILAFANDVLLAQPAGTGYYKELKPIRPRMAKPEVVAVMDAGGQAKFILAKIDELLDEGYSMSDMAVLYRAHYQALELQLEFTRSGLPFEITSGMRFFEQAHVKDFTSIIRFALNPKDQSAFLRFAALLPKVGPKTASNLFNRIHETASQEKGGPVEVMSSDKVLAKVPAAAKDDWADLAQTILDIETAARSGSPSDVVEMALEGWYTGHIRNIYLNWSERVDDLKGLSSFASRFDDAAEFLAQLVLLNSETSNDRIELGAETVKLTTIHQAKGLEYPIVFVIGLSDGMFPLGRAIDEGNVDEERRLFYVAVTRAKDQLYLTYPAIGQSNGGVMRLSPSRFLSEVSKERYELVRPRRQLNHGWQ